MAESDLETVMDVDGVLIGYVASPGDGEPEAQTLASDDAGLAVYDADYNFIGSARSYKVANELLRQQRARMTPVVPPPAQRRYAHSF